MKTVCFFCILAISTTLALGQAQKPQAAGTSPFVLGETTGLYSKVLGEQRTLNIYLPEGYRKEDTTRYPVIYLLDGSADEDFIHIAGLVQFNSFAWVNQVPKSILVGIATVDRRRDFTFPTAIASDRKAYPTAGHSGRFIAFMEQELQPFIQAGYKTTASKTIIGQSLGGLLATEVLLKKPNLFDRYIIVSPSLWWNNGALLDHPLSALANKDIYIGVGKEGLAPTQVPRVMEVDANLLAEKVSAAKANNSRVYFDYLPLENHATVLHQAVANAFRLIYPKGVQKP